MRRTSTRAQRQQPRRRCLRSGAIERPRTYTRAALPNAATHIAVCVDHDFLSAARLTRRVPNALRRPIARALPFSRSGGSECNLRPAGSPLPRSSCEPYYSCAATAERGVVDPGGCAIFAGFVYTVSPGASGGLDARCDEPKWLTVLRRSCVRPRSRGQGRWRAPGGPRRCSGHRGAVRFPLRRRG